MKRPRLVLSCEHAGNRVPSQYRYLFAEHPGILETHRGYDIGIAPVARKLQQILHCQLLQYHWTRLLIDPNRTVEKKQFSEFSRSLSSACKMDLIKNYHAPYHQKLDELTLDVDIIHISLHSFTPVLNGKERKADIGILYDPSRPRETALATALQKHLRTGTGLRVFRNYPYRGTADGAVTRLRKKTDPDLYRGIEIEINQALLSPQSAGGLNMAHVLSEAISFGITL